jgi:ribosomal protein S18 acetylase RimI-like enzyme
VGRPVQKYLKAMNPTDLYDMEVLPITLNDLILVADVHLAAFPDAALSKFGRETVRRYYLWYLSSPHDSVGIGVFVDRKMAGYCVAGVFRGSETIFLRQNIGYLIWYLATHPWLFEDKSVKNRINDAFQMVRQRIFRALSNKEMPNTERKDMFGILAIAVEPRYQRFGVGNLLLRDVERLALERGFNSMRLSVHLDNDQAASFYEKHDWEKIPGPDGKWQGYMMKEI